LATLLARVFSRKPLKGSRASDGNVVSDEETLVERCGWQVAGMLLAALAAAKLAGQAQKLSVLPPARAGCWSRVARMLVLLGPAPAHAGC